MISHLFSYRGAVLVGLPSDTPVTYARELIRQGKGGEVREELNQATRLFYRCDKLYPAEAVPRCALVVLTRLHPGGCV